MGLDIGLVHCNHARWREAMAAFQRARRLCESVLATAESERLQAADLYHNIGYVHSTHALANNGSDIFLNRFVYDCQQNLTEALLMYEKAKTIRERILGTSHVVTALTYNNIAQILRDQKRWRVCSAAMSVCSIPDGGRNPCVCMNVYCPYDYLHLANLTQIRQNRITILHMYSY